MTSLTKKCSNSPWSLTDMYISSLSHFIAFLRLSKFLGYVYLMNNRLEGSIPIELSNLINLEELFLSGNFLNGSIPTQLGDTLTNIGTYVTWQ